MTHSAAPSASRHTQTPWPDRRFFWGLATHYRRLLGFVRPYWRSLVIAGLILILNSLTGLVTPWVVQRLVDTVFAQADFAVLNQTLGLLLLISLAQAGMGFGQTYLIGRVGERVVADLRKRLYEHLHTMPLRFFAATRVGELTSRLGNDVMTIQEAVTSTLLNLVSQALVLIGGIAIILVISWQLTLVMLTVVPLAILGILILGRIVRRLSREVQDHLAELSATAEEALAGVRIVKSFAREPYEVARYGEKVEQLYRVSLARVRVRAIVNPIIGFLAFVAIMIVLWVGGRLVNRRRTDAGGNWSPSCSTRSWLPRPSASSPRFTASSNRPSAPAAGSSSCSICPRRCAMLPMPDPCPRSSATSVSSMCRSTTVTMWARTRCYMTSTCPSGPAR